MKKNAGQLVEKVQVEELEQHLEMRNWSACKIEAVSCSTLLIKKLILMFIIFLPIAGISQNSIQGELIDAETGRYIEYAVIYSSSSSTMSNELGEFEIDATDNDSLSVKHIGYYSKKVAATSSPLSIKLQAKIIELNTVVVVGDRYARIRAVYEKYAKLFTLPNTKWPKVTTYYRQNTLTDSINTEFVECFFNSYSDVSFHSLSIIQGRYAEVSSKRQFVLSFRNAFSASTISPVRFFEKHKKHDCITPLSSGASSIFDIKLESIMDANTSNEIYIYRFRPKEKQVTKARNIIGGLLYIRTRDNTIVKFVGETDIYELSFPIGIKLLSRKFNVIISYKDYDPCPIVESVKTKLQFTIKRGRRVYNMEVNTIMFVTDFDGNSNTGEVLKSKETLIKEIKEQAYDPLFWQENAVIKRTPIENKIIEDFNKQGYFGNFKF